MSASVNSRGGARAGSGRKAVDSEQITIRVSRETARRLRAEAERLRPANRTRLNIGKVIEDLTQFLPD